MESVLSRTEIGRRLVATRRALGKRAADVCADLGFSSALVAQWETGKNRPQLDYMLKYVEFYGLTLDWIYRGRHEGLPHYLVGPILKEMKTLPEDAGTPRVGRGRPRAPAKNDW